MLQSLFREGSSLQEQKNFNIKKYDFGQQAS